MRIMPIPALVGQFRHRPCIINGIPVGWSRSEPVLRHAHVPSARHYPGPIRYVIDSGCFVYYRSVGVLSGVLIYYTYTRTISKSPVHAYSYSHGDGSVRIPLVRWL